MEEAQPAATINIAPRPQRRSWPAVVFWTSLGVVFVHAALLLFVYSHLKAWLEPLSYLLLTPTGLFLLIGLPVAASALLGYLIFTYRAASSRLRIILILQVVTLIVLRAGLHFVPGGILCRPIEAIGFKMGEGPRLQGWAQSILADPAKAGLEKPSKAGFPEAPPGYEGNLPPDRLPSWVRRLHPNVADISLQRGCRSLSLGVD
ncbi:MAG TPA: hypothetical protein VFW40_08795 [Capsulimonadaceae bacterium]|nr:hypothetical protein [Capsulimonadaceae bacterium]